MKAVLMGIALAVILAFGASVVLEQNETPVTAAYSTEGVRLSEGH